MAGDGKKQGLSLSDIADALPVGTEELNSTDRAGLVSALKSKLQSLVQHADVLESLSPNVKKRVEFLKEMQSEHDKLEAKFLEEKAALEAKYEELYAPLYNKRYEIVNGLVEVEGIETESKGEAGSDETESEGKGVPDFWLTAFKAHEVLVEEVQERDEAALKFLKDIKSSKVQNPKGFKLEFFFDENPYFKNTILTKTYQMAEDDDQILEKATGTEIEWHPGKNLTKKVVKKKPKKGSKSTKPIIKTEDCTSFFNFFNPPQVPDNEALDEETAEDLECRLEEDYEVGTIIRDKIIPHAVSWFTGEAAEAEEFYPVEVDDEEDEDEDEEGTEEADAEDKHE